MGDIDGLIRRHSSTLSTLPRGTSIPQEPGRARRPGSRNPPSFCCSRKVPRVGRSGPSGGLVRKIGGPRRPEGTDAPGGNRGPAPDERSMAYRSSHLATRGCRAPQSSRYIGRAEERPDWLWEVQPPLKTQRARADEARRRAHGSPQGPPRQEVEGNWYPGAGAAVVTGNIGARPALPLLRCDPSMPSRPERVRSVAAVPSE